MQSFLGIFERCATSTAVCKNGEIPYKSYLRNKEIISLNLNLEQSNNLSTFIKTILNTRTDK